MLTTDELRRVAARSGARDIGKVEIDVILTHVLQLFTAMQASKRAAMPQASKLPA